MYQWRAPICRAGGRRLQWTHFLHHLELTSLGPGQFVFVWGTLQLQSVTL